MTISELLASYSLFDTVNFFDSVDALSAKTVVSQFIARPFTVLAFRANFALNTNRLLRLYFFVSPDSSSPTFLPLTGTNLLQFISPQPFLVGDGDSRFVFKVFDVPEGGSYLKVFASNLDAFEHTIDAQIFIVVH